MQTPAQTSATRLARAIDARLADLTAGTRLSAWSLIVTFMGDAIGPRGGEVSAAALQTLMGRLGIGHGAVRTAISRLSADGWIERRREGRNSFYRLSPDVAETVLAAEQRIYAKSSLLPAATPLNLLMASTPLTESARQTFENQGALSVSDAVLLWFGSADPAAIQAHHPDLTIAKLDALAPGAGLRAQLREARLADEFAALRAAYQPIENTLRDGSPPKPEDAMALRCLMIHEWRRIALRVLAIPAGLIADDDPEPDARSLVARIYRQTLAPSETWLDHHATTSAGAMPPASPRLALRFGPD